MNFSTITSIINFNNVMNCYKRAQVDTVQVLRNIFVDNIPRGSTDTNSTYHHAHKNITTLPTAQAKPDDGSNINFILGLTAVAVAMAIVCAVCLTDKNKKDHKPKYNPTDAV